MELVLENGWYGNQWMGDHMAPLADVVEDKDAYHFYVEMPGSRMARSMCRWRTIG